MAAQKDQVQTINSSLAPQRSSENTNKPQSGTAITLLLIRLASHYYRPDFTESQAKAMIADMVEDLEEFTLAAVEVAIRTYRRDPERRFFPRAADLRGLILEDLKSRGFHRGDGRPLKLEFGEHRPLGWEYHRKRYWKPHWRAADLDTASDPQRRARYDQWLARVKAGAVEGKGADEY